MKSESQGAVGAQRPLLQEDALNHSKDLIPLGFLILVSSTGTPKTKSFATF